MPGVARRCGSIGTGSIIFASKGLDLRDQATRASDALLPWNTNERWSVALGNRACAGGSALRPRNDARSAPAMSNRHQAPPANLSGPAREPHPALFPARSERERLDMFLTRELISAEERI